MKVRLFNDNGGETYTDLGKEIAEKVQKYLRDLIVSAKASNVHLRDIQTIVQEELAVECAFERIRGGVTERKMNREVINYQI